MFLKRCGRNSHSLNAIKHRSTRPEVFCKKGVLKNFTEKFTGKYLCQSLFFNSCRPQTCNLIEKETLAQVFSCEFCEISKNTFFYRTPLVVAPESNCYSLFQLEKLFKDYWFCGVFDDY